MSHEIDIPDLNENGTVFDDTYDVLKSDGLTQHEIGHLQEIYNADINKVSEETKQHMVNLASEINHISETGINAYGAWEQPKEQNSNQYQDDIRPESVPLKQDTYQVQLGDTLWDIVKNKYELQDNADIANMVNIVVESQKSGSLRSQLSKDTKPNDSPDGIKGDQLWAGDIIYLPPKLEKT